MLQEASEASEVTPVLKFLKVISFFGCREGFMVSDTAMA